MLPPLQIKHNNVKALKARGARWLIEGTCRAVSVSWTKDVRTGPDVRVAPASANRAALSLLLRVKLALGVREEAEMVIIKISLAEYIAVPTTPTMTRKPSKGGTRAFLTSKRSSFEYSPVEKGAPIRARELTPRDRRGVRLIFLWYVREAASWTLSPRWSTLPAPRNSIHLNWAWEIKWARAARGWWCPMAHIIKPICLRVEKAIIFFISLSTKALLDANSKVHRASRFNHLRGIMFGERIRR
jgi:hypothetical protein